MISGQIAGEIWLFTGPISCASILTIQVRRGAQTWQSCSRREGESPWVRGRRMRRSRPGDASAAHT
ncbi:hypothetical protein ACFPRL_25595 [Pseudoclavibacter helvolus]